MTAEKAAPGSTRTWARATGSGAARETIGSSSAAGIDYVKGEAGDDREDRRGRQQLIDGGSGANRVSGGRGSNTLYGGLGRDRLTGPAGFADSSGGADRITGGSGYDELWGSRARTASTAPEAIRPRRGGR